MSLPKKQAANWLAAIDGRECIDRDYLAVFAVVLKEWAESLSLLSSFAIKAASQMQALVSFVKAMNECKRQEWLSIVWKAWSIKRA